MIVREFTGNRLHISVDGLLELLLSRGGRLYVILLFLLMLLSDPPGLLSYMPMYSAALAWLVAFVCYFVSFFLIAYAVDRLQARGIIGAVWMPLMSLLAISPIISAGELTVSYLAGPKYKVVLWTHVAIYYGVVQIAEIIFMRFIYPALAQDAAVPEQLVHVGDKSFAVDRLRYLEAQEHYVRIVLDDEEFKHRARLGDVLAQLDDDAGVQPHRSWWISRASDPTLSKASQRASIELFDGTVVPVARGRMSDVQSWFAS